MSAALIFDWPAGTIRLRFLGWTLQVQYYDQTTFLDVAHWFGIHNAQFLDGPFGRPVDLEGLVHGSSVEVCWLRTWYQCPSPLQVRIFFDRYGTENSSIWRLQLAEETTLEDLQPLVWRYLGTVQPLDWWTILPRGLGFKTVRLTSLIPLQCLVPIEHPLLLVWSLRCERIESGLRRFRPRVLYDALVALPVEGTIPEWVDPFLQALAGSYASRRVPL